ncbi:MAG: secretion system protein E, partial [Archaeoglobaceae archaeon]|nr:secretion system protein E [Archaeoglobaceae archaeon]
MATKFRIRKSATELKARKEQRSVFEMIKKSAKGEWLDEEASKNLAKKLMLEFKPPEGWFKVEEYPIFSRFVFASAHILYNDDENEYGYFINEPPINEEEKRLVKEIVQKLEYYPVKPQEISDKYRALRIKVNQILDDFRIKLEGTDYIRILYHIMKKTIFYDRITP